MKNLVITRMVTVLLATALLLTTMMGGAFAQAQQDATITFPLESPAEIRIAAPDGMVASLADNLPLWQEIERLTNVKITWDVIAPVQYVEVMKLRIAAGTNQLADIMLLPNGLSMTDLGAQGIIVPLETYIERNGANIKAMYEAYPALKPLTSAGGHIYSINALNESAYLAPYCFVIRKDWLDRLNLSAPETIEDWMTVLTAFKDQDANGNGDPSDEIPFSAGGHAWYTTFWGNAWDLHLFQTGGYYPDENGTMQFEFISEKAREFYTWLNQFYTDGLLDPEFMTLGSEDKMFEKVVLDQVGAFMCYPSNIPTLEAALIANGVEDAYILPLVPPKGPYAQMTEIVGDLSVDGFVVTSNCDNPDLAVALMNFLYGSQQGEDLMNFGVEGWTYNKAADGTYSFTDIVTNDPNGLSASEVLEGFGCQLGLPYVKSSEREEVMMSGYSERQLADILDVTDRTRPFAISGLILPPQTEEETEAISGVGGDLMTYVWEMTGRFTIGSESMDQWDAYVQTIKDMGIDEILKVRQAQYDRLVAQPAQ